MRFLFVYKFLFICAFSLGSTGLGQTQSKKSGAIESDVKVEWYQPEVDKSDSDGKAILIISGKTKPGSKILVDGESIAFVRTKAEIEKQQIRSQQTVANSEGYFEIEIETPPAVLQIPIGVQTINSAQKIFLISFDVNLDRKINTNTEISKNKPPAAAKSLRAWFGLGTTLQKYNQSIGTTTDVEFESLNSPSVLGRFGYWGNKWGFDLFFRDAPGKIDGAVDPFVISPTKYHWTTVEARGLYQFSRGDGSRIWGLPSQWQMLFGTQAHKIPFLSIDGQNNVVVVQNSITMLTLGVALLLAQEKKWSYEFAFDYQYPIQSSASGGKIFTVASSVAYDVRIGATYKIASNWRMGLFSYLQSHTYSFTYDQVVGKQNIIYSSFDLHLGFDY